MVTLIYTLPKCRQGVNDPTDPRRINILFVNDGDGHYTQNAKQYGLAIGHQTWTLPILVIWIMMVIWMPL
jgi:hypothetical protein